MAGDGNAYIPYTYSDQTSQGNDFCNNVAISYQDAGLSYTGQTVVHHAVLQITPSGTATKTPLEDITLNTTCSFWLPSDTDPNSLSSGYDLHLTGRYSMGPVTVITNADSGVGVFIPWMAPPADYYVAFYYSGGVFHQYYSPDPVTYGTDAILVTQNAAGSVTPIPIETFAPSLQRSDGSYIGAGFGAFNTCSNGGMSEQSILAAVNVGRNRPNGWDHQLSCLAAEDCSWPAAGLLSRWHCDRELHLCTHLSDGSVVVTSSSQCTPGMSCSQTLGTLYTLDPSGNVTDQTADPGATTLMDRELVRPSSDRTDYFGIGPRVTGFRDEFYPPVGRECVANRGSY